jgi:hypothetical protein
MKSRPNPMSINDNICQHLNQRVFCFGACYTVNFKELKLNELQKCYSATKNAVTANTFGV